MTPEQQQAVIERLLSLMGRGETDMMAADTSVAMARRVLDSYAAAAPERVVITKLDEAETVAPLLAVLRERQLSLSYLACGQRIPEDLMNATADGLAHAILGTSQWEGTCH